jgi:alpha-tubulin suppressor-like RCC1 family protein
VTDAIAVDVGRHFSCALLVNSTVECWGYNLFGELGNGTIGGESTIAAPVMALSGVTALASGDHHTCAVSVAGTVECWGWNLHGELAVGMGGASGIPLPVAGVTGATVMAAEDFDSCALLATATVQCWGYNAFGELGNNTLTDSSTPGPVLNLTGVTTMAMKTDSASACAIVVDGTLRCWGYNGYGELGRGQVTGISATPGAVFGLSGVVGVSLGDFHTCALLVDGTVRCWGYNAFGQLGNGNTTDSSLPVPVNDVAGVTSLGAADDASCALLVYGTFQCWG